MAKHNWVWSLSNSQKTILHRNYKLPTQIQAIEQLFLRERRKVHAQHNTALFEWSLRPRRLQARGVAFEGFVFLDSMNHMLWSGVSGEWELPFSISTYATWYVKYIIFHYNFLRMCEVRSPLLPPVLYATAYPFPGNYIFIYIYIYAIAY